MTESKTKELERICLASLLQYNEKIGDFVNVIKSEFFVERVHSTLFQLIVAAYQEHSRCDSILLVTHAKALGISTINDYDIYSYIEVLNSMAVGKESIDDYFKELVKFHVLRKTHFALGDCQKFIKSNLLKPVEEILPELEKKLTEAVNLESDGTVEFSDLYGEIEQRIKSRAESESNFCILTGYKLFDLWYGGMPYESLNIVAAPAKVGKSTFLLNVAVNASQIKNNNCKVLYLDTELSTNDVSFRTASSHTMVNEWEFRTGNFVKNKQSVSKSEYLWDFAHTMKGKIFHAYTGDTGASGLVSICRRWHAKYIKPGEAALIIIDYLKLGNEGSDLKEWEEMGKKTNALKQLASSLKCTSILTATQTNEQGSVAQSARLKWFCSNCWRLERLSPEEVTMFGTKNSHKLTEIVIRNQGEHAHGANNLVKVQMGDGKYKYMPNYINYNIDKFKMAEIGSFEDTLNSMAGQLEPENSADPYENIKF